MIPCAQLHIGLKITCATSRWSWTPLIPVHASWTLPLLICLGCFDTSISPTQTEDPRCPRRSIVQCLRALSLQEVHGQVARVAVIVASQVNNYFPGGREDGAYLLDLMTPLIYISPDRCTASHPPTAGSICTADGDHAAPPRGLDVMESNLRPAPTAMAGLFWVSHRVHTCHRAV